MGLAGFNRMRRKRREAEEMQRQNNIEQAKPLSKDPEISVVDAGKDLPVVSDVVFEEDEGLAGAEPSVDHSLTLVQLREIAEDLGIERISYMKKGELIEAINNVYN